MAEATAVSDISVLPDEVMIEILSRVDSRNHLELRCVCKLWKSLVLDPHFMQNQHLISITELAALRSKVTEHFNAFKSRIINKLTVVPNAEEEEEEEEEEENVDAADAEEDVEDAADVDGADAEEEEDADGEVDGVDVDADGDGADAQEEEEEEEDADGDVDAADTEEDVDVDDDADADGADAEEEEEEEDADAEDEEDLEEEEDEEEQLKTKVLNQLVNLAEKEKQLMKNGKNLNNHDEQLMIIRVAKLDTILRIIRYLKSFMLNFLKSVEEDRVVSKGTLEAIRLEIRTMADRVTCFESFQQIYLKGLQHC